MRVLEPALGTVESLRWNLRRMPGANSCSWSLPHLRPSRTVAREKFNGWVAHLLSAPSGGLLYRTGNYHALAG